MWVTLEDGTRVQLGEVLARAGEGTIYTVVGQPEWVAKIFHSTLADLDTRRAKIAAMIKSPPAGMVQDDGFVVLTWPMHAVTGSASETGYVMSRVDTARAVEIHALSNPSNRANPLPSSPQWTKHATWKHLLNIAANLCFAVDVVHRVDAVIGDFQERNILVSDTTRVTLVDCDSMQFIDDSQRKFLCTLGRPEFTAPELMSVDLATTAREKSSDLFALAIHIYLLLMAGNHPFMRGTWRGEGEQPDSVNLAKLGQWAGGPGSALETHPLAPPITFLPVEIQALFGRAFGAGPENVATRPTASEWHTALRAVTVRRCTSGTHEIPAQSPFCPWCRIEQERERRRADKAQTASTTVAGARTGAGARAGTAQSSRPQPVASSQNRSANPWWWVVIAAVAALVVIVIAVVINSNKSSSGSSSSGYTSSRNYGYSTTTAYYRSTSAYPPSNAVECGSAISGRYGHAAVGNTVTSCQFAINVRLEANRNAYVPSTLSVFSPVTNQWYTMSCSTERVLTCRGGNDAVVYLY